MIQSFITQDLHTLQRGLEPSSIDGAKAPKTGSLIKGVIPSITIASITT